MSDIDEDIKPFKSGMEILEFLCNENILDNHTFEKIKEAKKLFEEKCIQNPVIGIDSDGNVCKIEDKE